jgi:carboxyl-terminal processing protease
MKTPRAILTSFLVLLSIWTQAALAQTLTPEAKENVLKSIEQTVTRRAFVAGADFAKWPEFLEKHRKDIDAATDVPAFTREVNRAFREFGFSHIGLRSPRQFQSSRSTSAIGIGVIARKEDEGLRVSAVIPNGPAAGLGLEAGDIIVEVDGKAPPSTDVLDGDEGTKLTVKVKKGSGETKEFELERKRYSTVRPETLTWVDEEAVVLRIPTFNVGYNREAIEKMLEDAARAKYLIIDLRSNGGGLVANMRHLLGQLLPEGSPIGTSVTKEMAERYGIATKGDTKDPVAIAAWVDSPQKTRKGKLYPFPGKIAVLINRGSGSASEITAAALKEDAGALLVGTRSAGAVLTSLLQPLPEGFGLQYPVTDYITARGVRLEGNPLKPDVEVQAPPPGAAGSTAAPTPAPAAPGAAKPDIVVEKAVEKLRELSATANHAPMTSDSRTPSVQLLLRYRGVWHPIAA